MNPHSINSKAALIGQQRESAWLKRQVMISIIVPVYNEEAGIAKFLIALQKMMQSLQQPFEIIVVDDGSTDQTLELLAALNISHLKCIHFSKNFGKEKALTAGLDRASGHVSLMLDADFQHPLHYIPEFLTVWRLQAMDMVYGLRKNRDQDPWLRRIATRIFYQLLHWISEVDILDGAGDFRLMDRAVVDAINRFEEHERFMKGIYAWVGFKTHAIPIDIAHRMDGSSHFSLSMRGLKLALTAIFSFSDVPLRIWSILGLLMSSIAFLYGLDIFLDVLLHGSAVPGYATLVLCILFFGGMQLLSIGILGEYIGRIFNEVKRRPQYIVSQERGFAKKEEQHPQMTE